MKLFNRRRKRQPRRITPRVRGIYDPGRRPVLGPDGTKYDGLVSIYSGFEPLDASLATDLRELKRASRVEAARGGYLRSAVLTFKREVIGSGIHLHSLHPNRDIGAEIEMLWNKWAEDMADASGQRTLRGLLHTMVASLGQTGWTNLYAESLRRGASALRDGPRFWR